MSTVLLDRPAVQNLLATGRDHLSFSSLNLYRTCPLRWFYRYRLGLPEESVSSALVFGASIHHSIEHHFRELLAGNPPPSTATLLAKYWEGWRERNSEEIRFGKGEDLDSFGDLAQRTLAAFQASDVARPAGQILAVEEELRGSVIPGCPDLLGRVDLIVDEGDALIICDWKTARSRWSQEQAEAASEQLLLYSELAKDFAPGKPVKLEFAILTKAREPVVDRHLMPVDPAQVARTKQVVERVWRAIELETFYPAPSAMNCPSCPYRDQCRSWCG
jgi:CRISPR/Cas system-associated exonuclease Cas4 (RecB family)